MEVILINTTIATFMKIGITSLAIGLLLFGVAYTLMDEQAKDYRGYMQDYMHEEYE